MKELQAYQYNPQKGDITIILRVDKHIIYLKVQAKGPIPIKEQMIKQFQSHGAAILESRDGWMRINMFAKQPNAKLGNIMVDIEEEKPEIVEIKLYNFFSKKYKEAKFKVTGKTL